MDPSTAEGYTNIEDDFIYTIRFQNTGNASAFEIEIRDTLSEFLDANSVEYIRGSHDEHLTFTRVENNILIFKFENINLPDSTSNFEESQGFVVFSVSPLDDLNEGTIIENTAHIYFDNNPSIVTNTVKNTLYYDMDGDGYFSIEDCDDDNVDVNPGAEDIPDNGIDEDCDGMDATTVNVEDAYFSGVRIYPNPSTDVYTISVEGPMDAEYSIKDIMGKTILKGSLETTQSLISLGDQPNGVYILELRGKLNKSRLVHRLLKI